MSKIEGATNGAKPTPGPWEVDENSPASVIALDGDCGMKRQWVATANGPTNASLIAAAGTAAAECEKMWYDGQSSIEALPDLLKVLEDTLKRIKESDAWWMDCPDRGGMDADKIQAAIAKARGKS